MKCWLDTRSMRVALLLSTPNSYSCDHKAKNLPVQLSPLMAGGWNKELSPSRN